MEIFLKECLTNNKIYFNALNYVTIMSRIRLQLQQSLKIQNDYSQRNYNPSPEYTIPVFERNSFNTRQCNLLFGTSSNSIKYYGEGWIYVRFKGFDLHLNGIIS